LVWGAALVVVTGSVVGGASGRGLKDIPKGFEKFAPLKPGLYQLSLSDPTVRFSIPDASWNGAQWVKNGYHVVVLSWRKHEGGWEMHTAPASKESGVSTLHRLETERAAGPNVGMEIRPAVSVTIGGFCPLTRRRSRLLTSRAAAGSGRCGHRLS